jgi:hypothetical protein
VNNPAKRVAFHVGAHKTATSLVQKYLRDKPEQFEGRGLVYVPRGDMNKYVGWGGKLVEDPDQLGDRVRAELDKPGTRLVFLSHENTLGRPIVSRKPGLYPHARKNLRAARKALAGLDVTIVISIRQQVDFLQSYYLQLVHEGGHDSFDDWFASIDTDELSWRPMMDAVVDLFGPNSLRVIDFDQIKKGQNEFLKSFFARIDTDVDMDPNYKPVRNASISEKGLKIALASNPYLESQDERSLMRKFLQTHFSNRDYPRPELLPETTARALRERYLAEYEQLTADPPRLA